MEGLIKKSKLQTSLRASIRFYNQSEVYYIFFLLREENIQKVTAVVTKNVFSILIMIQPDKRSEPKNNFDILFNSIIVYFKEINVSWPKTLKLSTAQHFAKTLHSML